MGLLGIGGSKSKSSSTAQSSSFDASLTQQSVAFADLFQSMYGNAASKAAGISGAQTGSAAQQLFSGGSQFLESLQGGGPGGEYLAGRVTGPDQVLGSQIGSLRDEISRLFSEEFNPAITSQAISGGALGGGRQGVAQGVAQAGLGREFSRGVVDLMTASQQQRDTAAGTLMSGTAQGAAVGLGGLASLLSMAQAGETSSLIGSRLLAEILGSPTTLTESMSIGRSQSTASSKSKSGELQLSFG